MGMWNTRPRRTPMTSLPMPRRFEIRRVPADIRHRDRIIGTRAPVLNAYERITFYKGDVRLDGKPPAALVAPGHPLLDATIDLVLERHRDTLRQGAVLVDTTENETELRILFFLEHSITDGRKDTNKNPLTLSRQLQFVEITRSGQMIAAGRLVTGDSGWLCSVGASACPSSVMSSTPVGGDRSQRSRPAGHGRSRILDWRRSEVIDGGEASPPLLRHHPAG